jgi:hypothetical protein
LQAYIEQHAPTGNLNDETGRCQASVCTTDHRPWDRFRTAFAETAEPPDSLAQRVEEAKRAVVEWPEWMRQNRDAVHVPIKTDDTAEPPA